MKTRQHRLNTEEAIQRKLPELIGGEVNVVLRDRTVLLGSVTEGQPGSVAIRNLRGKVTSIPMSGISEIYFDTKE
jgi:hypothetical protein